VGAVNSIAFLIPTIDRLGGAERQVLLLAREMCKRRWRVNVIALSGHGGKAAGELHDAGVGYLTLEMRKGVADPRGWLRLNRWLQRETPDVVHAHLPHAAWMARWSRLFAPTRVIVDTVHTSATGKLGRQLGYRFSSWLPDCVTTVSRGVADACQSAFMISRDRLVILPNGVDTEEWKPDTTRRVRTRHELGLNDEFLWLAAGRLEDVKDYPTMLRAMARVPTQSRLLIAGSGAAEPALRRLSKELGLMDRVRFLGFQPDVRPWMHAADGFVLSSRWEGLPMSLLEAGACAVPAVATDVPGSCEIIADGKTGFLAAPGDAMTLAKAMTRIMRLPPETLQAMRLAARQRIVARYGLDAVLDRWESLYHQMLDAHPRRSRWATAAGAALVNSLVSADGESTAGASEV
jgi:glycosyltransferase involved in cell wall biosynthesis